MTDTRYTAIAAALREEFPKANKGTVSMALHTNDYGVNLLHQSAGDLRHGYAAEATQTAPRKAHTVTVPVDRKHRTAR